MDKNTIINEDVDLLLGRSTVIDWSMLRNTRILISGATGMLGRYLVFMMMRLNDRLSMGIRVTIVVRDVKKAQSIFSEFIDHPLFNVFVADLSDNEFKLEGSFDYIIHNASQASPHLFAVDPVGTIKSNTIGSCHLLDKAVESRSKKFLFVSSLEVYGNVRTTAPFNETDFGALNTIDYRSCYSEGKRAGETIAVSYAHQYALDVNIMRLGFTYGPGMGIEDSRVQAYFMKCLLEGQDIILKSKGDQIRNYTYVSDAANALFHILLNGNEIVYNVADKQGTTSILGLAYQVAELNDTRQTTVVFDINEPVNTSSWSPMKETKIDTSRLESLGWRGLTTLGDGLQRWYTHLKNNI